MASNRLLSRASAQWRTMASLGTLLAAAGLVLAAFETWHSQKGCTEEKMSVWCVPMRIPALHLVMEAVVLTAWLVADWFGLMGRLEIGVLGLMAAQSGIVLESFHDMVMVLKFGNDGKDDWRRLFGPVGFGVMLVGNIVAMLSIGLRRAGLVAGTLVGGGDGELIVIGKRGLWLLRGWIVGLSVIAVVGWGAAFLGMHSMCEQACWTVPLVIGSIVGVMAVVLVAWLLMVTFGEDSVHYLLVLSPMASAMAMIPFPAVVSGLGFWFLNRVTVSSQANHIYLAGIMLMAIVCMLLVPTTGFLKTPRMRRLNGGILQSALSTIYFMLYFLGFAVCVMVFFVILKTRHLCNMEAHQITDDKQRIVYEFSCLTLQEQYMHLALACLVLGVLSVSRAYAMFGQKARMVLVMYSAGVVVPLIRFTEVIKNYVPTFINLEGSTIFLCLVILCSVLIFAIIVEGYKAGEQEEIGISYTGYVQLPGPDDENDVGGNDGDGLDEEISATV